MTTSGRIGAFITAGRGTAFAAEPPSVAMSFSNDWTVVVGMAAAVAIADGEKV